MRAYGAVAIVQSSNLVDFVLVKSRVSPLKDTTLPRLELRAAVTAACLAKFIISTLNVQIMSDYGVIAKLCYTGCLVLNSLNYLLPTG